MMTKIGYETGLNGRVIVAIAGTSVLSCEGCIANNNTKLCGEIRPTCDNIVWIYKSDHEQHF